MKRNVRSSLTAFMLLAGGAAALVYFLWPPAIEVEAAVASLAPMRVTIDEDGRTRVKDRYVVSAPLDGELLRVGVRAGDRLEAGKTILASILPKAPDLLDARLRAEAEAKVRVAEAAHLQAERRVAMAREAHELARHLFERARGLLSTKAITTEEFETVEHKERIAAEETRAAEFGQQVTRFEVELARAALVRTRPAAAPTVVPKDSPPDKPALDKPALDKPVDDKPPESADADDRLEIRSPITGQVFRVLRESAMFVRSGSPLVEVGDARDLEIEVDLLSSDAVRVKPGARMLLEHWGGERPLVARVRLIEPSGFTKVSALGVEEQRVNVIADFVDDVDRRPQLGDGFRVEARVVEWESSQALVVPAGAVFRRGADWAVYVVAGNRARLKAIQVGHHNGQQAEVLGGLPEGERVVLHPSDRISDGTRIRIRNDLRGP